MNASIGLGWSSNRSSNQTFWLAAPAVLSALLFYLDLHAPDLMFFGLPYLLVVIAAQSLGGGAAARTAASAAAALVMVTPFLSSAPAVLDPAWMAFVGRGAVVASIGMMVLFLRQRDEARETLVEQVGALENTSSQRSYELRLVSAQLHREIAERRRAELRSGYLASIVESSGDAIVGLSPEGTVVSWNGGAASLYGRDRTAVVGQSIWTLCPAAQQEELRGVLTKVARGQRVDDLPSQRLRADGSTFHVSAAFSPILDEKGSILGVSVIERDISRRQGDEHSLQKLNAELEWKVRHRTEDLESALGELDVFTRSIAGDVLAPLRSLSAATEAINHLGGEGLGDREKDLLTRIRAEAAKIDRNIEALLLLTQVEDRHLEKEVVNLGDVARAVIEDLRVSAPERHVEWTVGNGLLAWGDAGLLRTIVKNLLSGAFRATEGKEKSTITISVEHRAEDGVTYCVRDNGPAFGEVSFDGEFRPFSRIHRSRGVVDAAAVAMAIVERIIKCHGGTLAAGADADQGAVFRFRLPVPKRSQAIDDGLSSDDESAA